MTDGTPPLPWYRRTLRWGQTNLNELDPTRYDAEWWREYWRRTRVQGLVVNAGGIVAYYPSRYPLHYRAEHLGDPDFGDIPVAMLTGAAHADELRESIRLDRATPSRGAAESVPGSKTVPGLLP